MSKFLNSISFKEINNKWYIHRQGYGYLNMAYSSGDFSWGGRADDKCWETLTGAQRYFKRYVLPRYRPKMGRTVKYIPEELKETVNNIKTAVEKKDVEDLSKLISDLIHYDNVGEVSKADEISKKIDNLTPQTKKPWYKFW